MIATEADQMYPRVDDGPRLGLNRARDLRMAAIVEGTVAIVDDRERLERVAAERVLRVAAQDRRGPADGLRPEAGAGAVADRRVEGDAPDRDVDTGQLAAVAAAHEG